MSFDSAGVAGVGAAAVSTIGTIAVVNTAAKVVGGATKRMNSSPRRSSRKGSSRKSKSYSVWD